MKIAVLPGDGIGTEIVAEAVKVLKVLGLPLEMETALVGGCAYDAHGHPLPDSTLKLAKEAEAILFGAVGDWKYDTLDRQVVVRPQGEEIPFEVQPFRRYCLMNGLDDIGLTLRHADKIRDFEAARLTAKPWLAQTLPESFR